jgi:4-amino-4-deoxy-L-arabinose transferase-like glycosyltransferase
VKTRSLLTSLRHRFRALIWRFPAPCWIALGAVVSLALNWRLFDLPMISDEGGYAYIAQRWLDGRGQLYDDLWVSRPQGIFLVYGAILRLLGGTVVDIRLGAWFVSVLTMAGVWRFTAAWRGPRIAAAATMIFALVMGSPAIEGFTANAEVFMALPAMLCALCLLGALRSGWSAGWLLAAGALAAVATLLKPSGIVMVPVAIGLLALRELGAGASGAWRTVLRGSAATLLGFVLAFAPPLVHGYTLGWDRYLYGAFTYRIFHQSSATNSPEYHAGALFRLVTRCWPLLACVVVVLVVRAGLARRQERRASVAGRRPAYPGARRAGELQLGIVPRGLDWSAFARADGERLLLRLWLLGCLAGATMGGDWWFHYLIQAAAPFAIWLAVATSELRLQLPRREWRALLVALTLLLLLPYHVLARTDRVAMTQSLYSHPGYVDQQALAAYLKEHTAPETPIFVAFDQAALYYLADRPAAYRYLYDQELQALPSTQSDLIALLSSPDRPRYIIGTRQVAPFEDRGRAFWAAVKEHYVLETTVRGVPIYRAKAEPADPRRFIP